MSFLIKFSIIWRHSPCFSIWRLLASRNSCCRVRSYFNQLYTCIIFFNPSWSLVCLNFVIRFTHRYDMHCCSRPFLTDNPNRVDKNGRIKFTNLPIFSPEKTCWRLETRLLGWEIKWSFVLLSDGSPVFLVLLSLLKSLYAIVSY